MSKSVKKILEYQKRVEKLVDIRSYDILELEDICLCSIGHIACYESFEHALRDLIFNGQVIRTLCTIKKRI